MLRRVAALLLRPLARLVLRLTPVADPWERLRIEARLALFGSGARYDFHWYFEGESRVSVRDLEGIIQWLNRCQYASDPHLFQEPDFWQHPRTFEHLRRGDCEDFALWAWRKLVELGYDADLIVGRKVPPAKANGRHAWVVFRRDGEEFLYEPSCRDRANAIRPLAAVKARYIPEFGVGPDRKRFAFAGYLYFLKHPHLGQPDAA